MNCSKTILLLVAFIVSAKAGAQNLDAAKERETIEILLSNESALDSIVDLALANSYYVAGYQAELIQQHENVRQEKNRWFTTFRLGINFLSLNTSVNNLDQSVTRVGVLPNVGFSLTLDPEKFINRGSYIREANQGIVRAETQVNHQRRVLRAEITRLYYQYLEALGIVELRTLAVQAQEEQCLLLEQRFRKGEGQLEGLLNNQSALVIAKESLLKAQLAARMAKNQINLMITDTEGYFIRNSQPHNLLK